MKLLLPRKALKPRTFRLGAQQSILLGGAVRVDVVAAPAATIYLTVWACPEVVTHLGKTDAAADRSPAPPSLRDSRPPPWGCHMSCAAKLWGVHESRGPCQVLP